MKDVGKRVRDERKRLGLTQGEFADELTRRGQKSGSSNISMIESGDVKLSLEMADVMADMFGTSIDWLAGRAQDRTPCWDSDDRIVTLVAPDRKHLTQNWIDFLQTLPDDVLNMMLASFMAMRQELDRHK